MNISRNGDCFARCEQSRRDGVIFVPRGRAEAMLAAKVKGGLEIPDFVRAILALDRVRRVGLATRLIVG